MASPANIPDMSPSINTLAEQLCRARQWAWGVFDNRIPGASRDLAWALIGLCRDFDPQTYNPWLHVLALEPETMAAALDLAGDVARLIRRADALQPQRIRERETSQ